jgi:aminoglycoside 2''-phosphotransferase
MTDDQALLAMIRDAVPDQALERIDVNREGMVNDIVIANGDVVYRFPKSAWGERALANELRILEIVRRHVSVPVPEPVAHHARLASHRLIAGEPLAREDIFTMPTARRQAVLDRLGAFLREVHTIPARELEDVPASDAVRTRADWLAFLEQVRETVYPLLFRYQRQAVDDHFAPVVSGRLELDVEPVLIHGDLAPYHILVTPDGDDLAGVIDFGTAGMGDPAIEFSTLLSCYGGRVVHELGHAYPLTLELLERARFLAGTLELQWALAGLRNNDLSLLVAHIGGARDYPPMGATWL